MIHDTNPLTESLDFLLSEAYLAVDTETTGLRPYGGDKLFSAIIANADGEWYFDFNGDLPCGERGTSFEFLKRLISDTPHVWFLANAKFDMAMLENFGISFHPEAVIHDILSVERLLYNQHMKYSLDSLARVYSGDTKIDAAKEYVKKHKCGYQDVPLDIMVPYAKKDARLTYDIGMAQLKAIGKIDDELLPSVPKVEGALKLQYRTTKAVYRMIRRGVHINRAFCEAAIDHEMSRMESAAQKFEALTGRKFKASNKLFADLFDNELADKTEKGNLSFNKGVFIRMAGNELAECVLEYRDAKSRFNYFAGFLEHAGSDNVLHTELNETGADTLRFSSSKPNLQNMKRPDEDDEDGVEEMFPVREAIVPPSEDFCIVSVDYSQQEMRLLLDYAGAMGMIEKVKAGVDVHQATADLAGISRQMAKGVNFSIIYGTGLPALAAKLKVDTMDAKKIVNSVMRASPEIEWLIKQIKKAAAAKGYVFTWNGTRLHLPQVPGKDMSYVMVNHLIQGGSAAITKTAICDMDDYLIKGGYKSYLALTVHDDIILMTHKDELFLAEVLADIMVKAYPHRHLPMAADISHSWENLAAKKKGVPILPA